MKKYEEPTLKLHQLKTASIMAASPAPNNGMSTQGLNSETKDAFDPNSDFDE